MIEIVAATDLRAELSSFCHPGGRERTGKDGQCCCRRDKTFFRSDQRVVDIGWVNTCSVMDVNRDDHL